MSEHSDDENVIPAQEGGLKLSLDGFLNKDPQKNHEMHHDKKKL